MTTPPLAMSREEAAYYIGFGGDLDDFDEVVGREMPNARLWVDGEPMWDRRELDRAFDALPYATKEDIERAFEEMDK